MTLTPDTGMQGWMRKSAKDAAYAGRRANPFPALEVIAGDVAALDARLDLLEALPAVRGTLPSSIVVGSGAASGAADGTVTVTTACSYVRLNGVFNGTGADVHDVIFHYPDATGVLPGMRLSLAGTDQTTNYVSQYHWANGVGATAGQDTPGYFRASLTTATSGAIDVMRFASPGKAAKTHAVAMIGNYPYIMMASGTHATATAYDGLTVFPVSGATLPVGLVVKVVKIA